MSWTPGRRRKWVCCSLISFFTPWRCVVVYVTSSFSTHSPCTYRWCLREWNLVKEAQPCSAFSSFEKRSSVVFMWCFCGCLAKWNITLCPLILLPVTRLLEACSHLFFLTKFWFVDSWEGVSRLLPPPKAYYFFYNVNQTGWFSHLNWKKNSWDFFSHKDFVECKASLFFHSFWWCHDH